MAIHRLGPADLEMMGAVLSVFGEAFDEEETYCGARPDPVYLKRLLAGDFFIALGALVDGQVVGGLAAYDLPKFEQERREVYIYDLAVAEPHRRNGIATALLREIRRIAASRGAWVLFVQADHGDTPAIELYTRLGKREDVLHFDLEPIEE